MKSLALNLALILVLGWPCHIPAAAGESPLAPGQISVVGRASIEAIPDLVEVELQVHQVADSVEVAKVHVDRVIGEILSTCNELGVDPSMISATDLSIAPHTQYDGTREESKFAGYEVERGVTIRLTKLASFNELLRRTVHVGVNQISRIEMKSTKEHDLQEQALVAAIKDAKRQAEVIAREAGRQIDKVFSVATDEAESWNGYSPARQGVRVAAEPMPVFQPGPITVYGKVFVTFSLK